MELSLVGILLQHQLLIPVKIGLANKITRQKVIKSVINGFHQMEIAKVAYGMGLVDV